MDYINISKSKLNNISIDLPRSKSISNRAIVINELSEKKASLVHLSTARDTDLMRSAISSNSQILNVRDAGTTMRFLTAFYSIGKKTVVLTGTPRMQKRPIKILVDSLNQIGADIEYLGEKGFPPLKINPFNQQKLDCIEVPGNISSQYISALLMIAPMLPKGLHIKITGKIGSRPYIQMTSKIMHEFGADVKIAGSEITILPKQYIGVSQFETEPDWSAASYWYSFVALSENGSAFLPNIVQHSLQGDSIIALMMEKLGVKSEFSKNGLALTKIPVNTSLFEWDFIDCPDLAQTVLVVCAAKGIKAKVTGLESLKIKETDRITALQIELGKFGATLEEEGNAWYLNQFIKPKENVSISTYEDHRMAMAFAPLSQLMDIIIEDPSVVNKSYPNFWKDVQKI